MFGTLKDRLNNAVNQTIINNNIIPRLTKEEETKLKNLNVNNELLKKINVLVDFSNKGGKDKTSTIEKINKILKEQTPIEDCLDVDGFEAFLKEMNLKIQLLNKEMIKISNEKIDTEKINKAIKLVKDIREEVKESTDTEGIEFKFMHKIKGMDLKWFEDDKELFVLFLVGREKRNKKIINLKNVELIKHKLKLMQSTNEKERIKDRNIKLEKNLKNSLTKLTESNKKIKQLESGRVGNIADNKADQEKHIKHQGLLELNNELQQKIVQLESKLCEAIKSNKAELHKDELERKKIDEMVDENKKYKHRISEINEHVENKDTEIKNLETKCNQLNSQLKAQETKHKEMSESIVEKLNREMLIAKEEMAKLENNNNELTKYKTDLELNLDRLDKEISSKDAMINSLEKEVQKLSEIIKSNDLRLDALSAKVNENNQNISSLENEKEELLVTKKELELKNKSMISKLKEKDDVLRELDIKQRDLSKKVKDLTEENNIQIIEHKKKTDELNTEINKATKNNDLILSKVDTLDQKYKDKCSEFSQLKTEYESFISSNTNTLKDKIGLLEQASLQLKAHDKDKAQLMASIEQLKSENSIAQQELDNSTKLTERILKEKEEFICKYNAFEKDLQEATIKIHKMQETLNSQMQDIEKGKEREQYLRNLNRELKTELRNVNNSSNVTSPKSRKASLSSTTSTKTNNVYSMERTQSDTDNPKAQVNLEYIRNVLMKFVIDKEHRAQLCPVLAHLLCLSKSDIKELLKL